MPSSELVLSPKAQSLLLELAREAIYYGARHGRPPAVELASLPEALCLPRASFVTLERQGRLRGCMGSLLSYRPLAEDVSYNAFAAAFRDPRFPPVTIEEMEGLDLHLSILSPLEEIRCRSEAELIAQLRPGIDGLVLEQGQGCGTFLPAVWKQLPSPRDFVRHLKLKAGLPPDYWSPQLKVYRYTTEVIAEARETGSRQRA